MRLHSAAATRPSNPRWYPSRVSTLRGEATRYNISVRAELAADLPQIVGDRVQLHQVAVNLIVNTIEAMKDVDGIREMAIRSQRVETSRFLCP